MSEIFFRTEMLIGEEGLNKLSRSHIAVFGIGGVGGYVVEAFARCGVGSLTIIDNDTVALSNLNRQIIATHNTIGRLKTDVMKERILSINPDANVITSNSFFLPENSNEFDFTQYDYIVDAIDTVTGKIEIIVKAQKDNIPVISCFGTGNKLDPKQLKIDDVYNTSVCPLAKVMRQELRKRNVEKLKVLYSTEPPITPVGKAQDSNRRATPGSVSFVPSVAGLIIAGEVINEIINRQNF
ncbi:MAG: tRNA threonylcarbamoyladenosine dehydratase [Eubacteriales bacterium]|nr:tRNA threonylcarbamoyladenosine dehydratase [Eubacteriales bacterium]